MENVAVSKYRHFSKKANTVIVGENFGSGQQEFQITLSGNKALSLKDSYLSYRITTTKGTGAAIIEDDKIALSMNLIPCMYEGVTVFINDEEIESVSKYVAQQHSIKTRSSVARTVLNGVLDSRELWEPKTAKGSRHDIIANVKGFKNNEIMYKPALSCFDNDTPLRNCIFRLALDAKSDARIFKSSFESVDNLITGSGATDFKISITRVRFHAAIFEIDTNNAAPYSFMLCPMETTAQRLRGPDTEVTSFNLKYNPESLTVAFQDVKASNDTRYSPSRFRVNPKDDVTGVIPDTFGEEGKLTSLSISHNGVERPNENDTLKLNPIGELTGSSFLQRYLTSSDIQERGYWADMENMFEVFARGLRFSYLFPKSGGETDRIVDVKSSFAPNKAGEDEVFEFENPNIFLFSTFKRMVTITPAANGETRVKLTHF